MQFLKIANIMVPDNRISRINLNATVNGQAAVEVYLFGYNEPYQFTGQIGSQAYDLLGNVTAASVPPVSSTVVTTVNGQAIDALSTTMDGTPLTINIGGKSVTVTDIEYVEFHPANSVEIRVATDTPGVTRQLTGDAAIAANEVLFALAGETVQAAA